MYTVPQAAQTVSTIPSPIQTPTCAPNTDLPPKYRGVILKALNGEASPRGAIKAKCLDCAHFDRAEIATCGVRACPIWSYRPYQQGGEE